MTSKKCFYCNENDADPFSSYQHTMYGITKATVVPTSVSYVSRKIPIEKRVRGASKHARTNRYIILPVLVFPSLIFYYFFEVWVYALFFGVVTSSVSIMAIDPISRTLSGNVEGNVEKHPEVKRLKQLKWRNIEPQKTVLYKKVISIQDIRC